MLPATITVTQEPPPTETSFIATLACKAHAVIVGTALNRISDVNDRGTFIYSENSVRVEKIWKDDRSAPLPLGTRIIVTRPGGEVVMSGKPTSAIDQNAPPLPIGSRVVLFLQANRAVGTYNAASEFSAFAMDGDRLKKITGLRLPDAYELKAKLVAQDVSTSSGC